MEKRKPRTVRYYESLVVYVDILGFKALIEKRRAGEISKLIREFRETLSHFPGGDQVVDEPEHFINFSDLCVLSVRLDKNMHGSGEIVMAYLRRLALAQMKLIKTARVLIRGGISIGLVAKSYGQLFGQGIISAYELESQRAKQPRILVDESVVDYVERSLRNWGDDNDYPLLGGWLRRDATDGERYLDYLGMAARADQGKGRKAALECHKKQVAEGLTLYAKLPAILSKYQWLKQYQDETTKSLESSPWPHGWEFTLDLSVPTTSTKSRTDKTSLRSPSCFP